MARHATSTPRVRITRCVVRAIPETRGRSASTGKFVKQATVKRHPKTTVNESTGKPKKK